MSRVLTPLEAPERVADVWAERWSDAALCDLGRWLVAHRHSDDEAMHAVARVWSFYSYAVAPVFRDYPPMALSARRDEDTTLVWLHLPEPPAESGAVQDGVGSEFLRGVLAKYERRPVAAGLTLLLELSGTSADQETRIRLLSALDDRSFFGVYRDDLVAELAKVMNPASVPVWLRTPNENYKNHRPEEFLNDPEHDRVLRDLILEVKSGLVA